MSAKQAAIDMSYRYIHDKLELHDSRAFPEFTMDELDVIRDYVNDKFLDEEAVVLHVFETIRTEFALGHRCSVCGRTDAQNKAIGYDCAEGC